MRVLSTRSGSTRRVNVPFRKLCRRLASGQALVPLKAGGLDLGLNLGAVGSIVFRTEQALGDLARDASPGEPQLNRFTQLATRFRAATAAGRELCSLHAIYGVAVGTSDVRQLVHALLIG